MYRAIAANKRNTVFFIVGFVILVGAITWVVGYYQGDYSITVIALVIALVYVIIQYYGASAEAVAMSGAIEIQKSDNPDLWNAVENIAISQGMPMPRVFVVNDPAPNAFATGRDPQHGVVCATTGLLQLMDKPELEAVMAHEMGHVRNYDIRLSTIVFGLTVVIGIIADIFLRMAFWGGLGGNRRDNNNGGGGNPIILILGLVALIVAPLVAALVQAAVSRQREYLADATSAEITRHPDALESALQKLADYQRPMIRQNTSMAHLWINDPNKPGLMSKLFST
ncbi:M48 family metalloprotease, partial [Gryllotalpicola sp.]|uniref:M48 family metalloprotease n=1 Tax=Gryllotalpicola sp. TaxID=1932787 RepID=UPI0026139C0B